MELHLCLTVQWLAILWFASLLAKLRKMAERMVSYLRTTSSKFWSCLMRKSHYRSCALEKTEWFPGDVKPVHVGWYERRCDTHDGAHWSYMAWWDGELFNTGSKNALIYPNDREWRGLTEPAA